MPNGVSDSFTHRNPKRFVVDSAEIKGGLLTVADLDEPSLTAAIGENKWKAGQSVWVESELKKYILTDEEAPTDPESYELEGSAAAAAALTGVSVVKGVQYVSANASVSANVGVVIITNSPTITMPDPAGPFYFDEGVKATLLFDNSGEGIATLVAFDGEEIEEATLYSGEKIEFYSNGVNWRAI